MQDFSSLKNPVAAAVPGENPRSAPVEGYTSTLPEIQEILNREVTPGSVQYVPEGYVGIENLVFARGKKADVQGTAGYIVHPDGAVEELPNKQKLAQLNWTQLRQEGHAIVVRYLNLTGSTYRVYKGATLADVFGITADTAPVKF